MSNLMIPPTMVGVNYTGYKEKKDKGEVTLIANGDGTVSVFFENNGENGEPLPNVRGEVNIASMDADLENVKQRAIDAPEFWADVKAAHDNFRKEEK